ncbi:MAG TPA: right-handed parallel beta-helix repeat-containing protein [Pyrinomonadaceae bacterium]
MKKTDRKLTGRSVRLVMFLLLAGLLFVGAGFLGSAPVEANHPVFVEGNCDSPVPGTTIASPPGFCGDFDGDGRIGTAEDTDGADRIFGTINAAMGPGTGAAAGTGANHNGLVLIVASGRYAESVYIGQNVSGPGAPGVANPGNVTLEAAPGVSADIDAILQGDPAGGNVARTTGPGIVIVYPVTLGLRLVTLRNLTIRNFDTGALITQGSRVNIDNCRFENNISVGINLTDSARVTLTNSHITGGGFRTGVGSSNPTPGDGIRINQSAQARIMNTVIAHNNAQGVVNYTGNAANVVLYQVGTFFNGADVVGPVTIAPNPNHSQ